jgi:hypothetical protein
MSNISEHDATQIAQNHLRELEERIGCELVLTKSAEPADGGFLFAYDGKRWIEDGEISYALAGNLPFLVKYDGRIVDEPKKQVRS